MKNLSPLALLVAFLTLVAPASAFFPRGNPVTSVASIDGWYNPAWLYRKTITIDHTKVLSSGGETYAGFPVLVSETTDANLAAHALSTGNDILFTASDGTTKLNHEIEQYTSGTGKLVAWVRVSSLSTFVDTVLYMYYGNAAAPNQQNVAGTWDSHFKGVYHLGPKDTSYTIQRIPTGNPVIPNIIGGWTDSQTYDQLPMVDPADSTKLIMFFSGMAAPTSSGHECIGRATATVAAPTVWTQYASNPIICDSHNRRVDSVIYTGGVYYMYSTDDTDQNIHLFTSTNGIAFTDQGTVLTPTGQGRNDGDFVSQGAVWLEGGVWTMIYSYRNGSNILPGYRYATSSNGTTWVKGGTGDILSKGPLGSPDQSFMEWHHIVKVGSVYYLTYECWNGDAAGLNGIATACIASSTSLTSGWVKSGVNPFFQQSKTPGAFDEYHTSSPGLFLNSDGTWYLFYSGSQSANPYFSHYQIGIATLPGTPADLVTAGVTDSTGANSLTGTALVPVTGKTGGAFTFDGVSSHASSLTPASVAVNNYTIQAWVNWASLSHECYVAMNGTDALGGGTGYGFGIGSGSGGPGNHFAGIAPGVAWLDSGATYASTGAWNSIVMQRNATTTSYRLNNVSTPNTFTNTPSVPLQTFSVGAGTTAFSCNGTIDEVRFSDVARSSGWLTTDYVMQNAPGAFLSIGPETTPSPSGPAPVFDQYPSLAPPAYCGVIKMRSAYAGNALQLALGSNPATTLDVGWITNSRGVEVANDAAVQTWLASNGNGYAFIKKCYDQSGNGFDYTVNSVTPPNTDGPYYKGATQNNLPAGQTFTPPLAEWLGFPSMNFYARNTEVGVASYMKVSTSVTFNKQAFSVMLAMTLNDSRSTGVTQTTQHFYENVGQWAWGNYQGNSYFSDAVTNVFVPVAPVIDWSVKGATVGAVNACVYDDLVSDCRVHGYSAMALSGGSIGSPSTGGVQLSMDGNVTAVLGPWGAELTPTEYGQVRDALKAQLNISATPTHQIVFDGDSITEAYSGQYSERHPLRAIARIYNDTGIRVRAYNVAVSGACIGVVDPVKCHMGPDNLTTLFSTKTAPLLALGSYTKRILYVMAGTNDIAVGTSAATTSGYVTSYISAARAAIPGVKVVYGGMISRESYDATCFTFMQNVISAASYDVLVGWYNDTNMRCQSGGGSNYNNTTYFSPDKIHPSSLGMDVGSAYDATAIESLLP